MALSVYGTESVQCSTLTKWKSIHGQHNKDRKDRATNRLITRAEAEIPERSTSTGLSLYASLSLDERHQRNNILAWALPYLLPIQPASRPLGSDSLGTCVKRRISSTGCTILPRSRRGPGRADRIGCFSGGAFISKEGVPTFIYYGFPDGICLATSQDDLLLNWTKHPDNPVIPAPQPGDPDFGKYTVHDPCAWLDGDTYYALLNRGNPEGRGDTGYLFKSDNLTDWEYLGEFLRILSRLD